MATMHQMMKEEGRAEGFADGMAAGMLEVRRSDLVKVLRVRFPDVDRDLVSIVRSMTDQDQLARWFEAALVSPSKEMFPMLAQDADQRAMLHSRNR